MNNTRDKSFGKKINRVKKMEVLFEHLKLEISLESSVSPELSVFSLRSKLVRLTFGQNLTPFKFREIFGQTINFLFTAC